MKTHVMLARDALCRLALTLHIVAIVIMDDNDNTWIELDEVIFSPEVIKLGMVVILERACSHNKSMHNLELFVNALVYERKKIILNETGLFISSSIFVPYDIMPENILKVIDDLIDSNLPRSIFKKDEAVHICFELPIAYANASNNALGVINVVCGFLLAINEASESKKIKKKTDHKLCIFDVILKSVFFKHRVEYSTVLRNCIRYGYCGPSEMTAFTESKVVADKVVPVISAQSRNKTCLLV